MIWLYVIAAVLVGVVVILLAGRWQGAEAPPEESPAGRVSPIAELLKQTTDRPIAGKDLLQVRFHVAVRGYHKAQVDDLIDELAAKLDSAHPGDEALIGAELQQAQFGLAAGGYRMEQVDKLLDALVGQLSGAALGTASEELQAAHQDDISPQELDNGVEKPDRHRR